MKKIFILTMLFACSLVVQAQTFFKIDDVRYMIEDDHAVVARQDRELTGDINIPATVNYGGTEYKVTRLMGPGDGASGGGGAFQDCEIKSIILPEAITEVPDNTFSRCKQLCRAILHGPVTRIGAWAFDACEALTTIELPDEVTWMGEAAFQGTGLTQFKIPAGVEALLPSVLAGTKIIDLEIPASVKKIEGSALNMKKTGEQGQPLRITVKMFQRDCRLIETAYGAFGLDSIATIDLLVPAGGMAVYQEYLPWMNMNSITEYGENTGEPLVPDRRHVIVDDVRYLLKDGEAHVDIQPETLSGDITITEKVTYNEIDYPVTTVMERYDFDLTSFSETQVTKVTLPSSIKKIGVGAFSKSKYLQEVVLNEGLTEIGDEAFSECPELKTINIPSTVATLAGGMFGACYNLKTLILPEGLTGLEGSALWLAGIETLTIPSTCTLLGGYSLYLPNLKTLIMKVKEPTDIKSSLDGVPTSTINTVFGLFNHDYDGFADYEDVRAHFKNIDLIVPLGCAEGYKMQEPWFNFRSITEEGSPYLKLNNSVFSAPEGAFTITNAENDGAPEFEEHEGEYEEAYTHGLCLKEGTTVSFSTTAENSQVHVYLFSNNGSTVKLDGTEMNEIGDDQSDTHSYRRYDMLVGAGEHTITSNTYEGNEWPCMFLLQVKDINGDYYQPKTFGVNIDGITYVLNETVNEENEIVRTATIARQNPSLSGDIVIPEKVSYAKKVLQGDEWVTLETHDYDVTTIFSSIPDGDDPGGGGAFQWCAITSVSLPATITTIPANTFNSCKQLKNVTLPEGITTIGGGAFRNCTSLEEIYLPETITEMSGLFRNCTSLKKVNIPKKITSLSTEFFWNSGIETFIIPKNVTSIGWACFAGTPLKSIKICHESYSDDSFSFPENIFDDISGITLIVPEGTKESLYSQIYPWKNFDNIIEYSDQHDEHQYNNYRVEFEEEAEEAESEEETPAASRSRLKKIKAIDEPVTAGFTPSGVAPELPTEIERNGKKYAVTYKESLAVMPANDVVLKVALTRIGAGDVNGDGTVDANDITEIVKYITNPWDGFNIDAADANDDGVVNIADIIYILNGN